MAYLIIWEVSSCRQWKATESFCFVVLTREWHDQIGLLIISLRLHQNRALQLESRLSKYPMSEMKVTWTKQVIVGRRRNSHLGSIILGWYWRNKRSVTLLPHLVWIAGWMTVVLNELGQIRHTVLEDAKFLICWFVDTWYRCYFFLSPASSINSTSIPLTFRNWSSSMSSSIIMWLW